MSDMINSDEVNKVIDMIRSLYGENKCITDDNYDKSLAVKCVNGTFVGKKNAYTYLFYA